MEERSIDIVRILKASHVRVWQAWTNAAEIAQWWGPAGFSNTIHQMDTTAGGEWRLTMHGPDGKNYANRSMFVEIVPMQKIIFQHYNPNYLAIVLFEPKDGQTQLNWTMEFETAELFDTVVRVFKADKGLKENVDKLEKYLTKEASS